MVCRTLQLSYYNDGGPLINWFRLGDKFDRFYSGGILLSYHGDLKDPINSVELGFHKFTGWVNAGFESANQLSIDYVPYENVSAYYYNQSRWKINVIGLENRVVVAAFLYNEPKYDLQNKLHNIGDNAYHPTLEDPLYGGSLHYKFIKLYSK